MQQNNDLNFEPQDVNIVNPKQARKAVIATGIGNAMEWFDFGLYVFSGNFKSIILLWC